MSQGLDSSHRYDIQKTNLGQERAAAVGIKKGPEKAGSSEVCGSQARDQSWHAKPDHSSS